MSSQAPGNITSTVGVTNVSGHGLWLLTPGKELFLSYEDFPWFRDQTIRSVTNVEQVSTGHFYWPDIDVDLTEVIIEHPEQFPLTAKGKQQI